MSSLLNTLKALGDETRLRILRVLRLGAFNVNELVGVLGMGQSRVSRHLKILLEADLVTARRQGSWVYYELSGRWSRAPGGKGADFLRPLAEDLDVEFDGDRQAVDACFQRRREQAAQFFRGVAERWDRHRDQVQGRPRYLDRLAASLRGPSGGGEEEQRAGTVVDLGTGTGVLLSRLSPVAERVIGIDQSQEMLRRARQNVTRWGLRNVELRLGALEHLPLCDGEADAMVANMVLHHVADPPQALREVRRGLRAGGKLVLAELATHGEENYREELGDLWLGFERAELERWLLEARLALESCDEERDDPGRPGVLLLVARSQARVESGFASTFDEGDCS
jgi:ArsR family transcriptional regulator